MRAAGISWVELSGFSTLASTLGKSLSSAMTIVYSAAETTNGEQAALLVFSPA